MSKENCERAMWAAVIALSALYALGRADAQPLALRHVKLSHDVSHLRPAIAAALWKRARHTGDAFRRQLPG
jgi:hypothetical protein